MWFYLDGIVRDETTSVGTMTASNLVWTLLGASTNSTMYDFRVFNKALTADECAYISRLNQAAIFPIAVRLIPTRS